MTHRIEIDSFKSSEAALLEKEWPASFEISRVYTIDAEIKLQKIAEALYNPVTETYRIDQPADKEFDYALELGFLPGVTDNEATTAHEIITDLLGDIGRNTVFSSKLIFISGLSYEQVQNLALEKINPLIHRYHIKDYSTYKKEGMDYHVPKVTLSTDDRVLSVNLNVDEQELAKIGKEGIYDPQLQQRRGPLALSTHYLKAIKEYYQKEGRNPTDIELESIAQTWSEHCKHTIFASEIDDIKEGIFKHYIKGATDKVRQNLANDFCISVFKDNSGAIDFNENYMITDKAETHNSPSALDPFGGAITGIVGVNRDTIGFGMGALPIANKYGFCVGRPEDTQTIYKSKDNPALLPRKILDGVVEGVKEGGNCSGIPTPHGFVHFDDSYRGKPLIFVGTLGLLPKKLSNGKPAHEKKAQPNDNIVVIGGRVGKDGIHGATFSSEAMSGGSPATAVQIGDPITQKKLSDAVCKEARELYNSITDNGAGGLSCSVAEMAEESGGFVVNLEKVPLKYPGLQPWEIWVSESQERMTLSVPDSTLDQFLQLMKRRGVEATVIGKFNGSDRAIVKYNEEKILDLDMQFLHHGLPEKKLQSKPYPYVQHEPEIEVNNQQETFEQMLSSHNISSFEFISLQYDHEVQNSSVVKPLIGKGRVNGNASVIRPLLNSPKGVVMSQSIQPRISEINCYDMAANAIDTAIRNAVAVGANINHMALMDNFCWCSSDEPERLGQLKDAAKGCYDYATLYNTPFISGKDSMFNDFSGFNENSEPIKISVLPTLMISCTSVIEDIKKTCTMDFKNEEDLVYAIGYTKDECGGSEFYRLFDKFGKNSPKVQAARKLYETIHTLHQHELLTSCASVEKGGMLITLAKMSIAGQLGAEVDLSKAPADNLSAEKLFYSESPSRFIATISPDNKEEFEKHMQGFDFAQIGTVKGDSLNVYLDNKKVISGNTKHLEDIYKSRFREF